MTKEISRFATSIPASALLAVCASLPLAAAASPQEPQTGAAEEQQERPSADAASRQQQEGRASSEGPTDRSVVEAAKQELSKAQGLDGESIQVSLQDGMVALSGEVENILAHDRAIRIAASVKGVRAIDDNITVIPSDRSDTQVERDVATALALDPATEYWEINALVSDGEVTLRGSVESLAEKSLASRVAKSVRGVRGVENEIIIDYPVDRTDEQIAHDVTQVLMWNTTVDSGSIDIDVEDDVVMLSGQVDSLSGKNQARRLAEVTGVKEVDVSNLNVRWTEENGDSASVANRTDEELTQAVRMALSLDPRVDAFEPTIEVEDGVVTLSGTVDNLEAKLVAADAARDTLGVDVVRNNLAVEPREPVPDAELEKRVSNALQRDPYVSNTEVDVTAVDGEIYLDGEADSWFEHYKAGEVAARVAGVAEVHNNVDVGYDRLG